MGKLFKGSVSKNVAFTVAFCVFCLYTAYILFFFLFAFLIATKENMVEFTFSQINKRLFSFPEKFTLMNFINAFAEWKSIDGKTSFLMMTWHSLWRAGLGTFLSIMATAMVCYILVFYKSKFTKFLYSMGLFVMILPLYGSGGAMYRLVTNIGIINTPFFYVTSITLFGGYFFYFCSFYKSLSWHYAEAAFIDGGTHYGVFFKIMFPMIVPSAMALFVMSFISSWNEYGSTLLYMQSYPDLAYGTYAYSEISKYNANVPAYFAGVLISILPVLALFLGFQNTIMEKVYLGGIKG